MSRLESVIVDAGSGSPSRGNDLLQLQAKVDIEYKCKGGGGAYPSMKIARMFHPKNRRTSRVPFRIMLF
jgi:hypothetical protein